MGESGGERVDAQKARGGGVVAAKAVVLNLQAARPEVVFLFVEAVAGGGIPRDVGSLGDE